MIRAVSTQRLVVLGGGPGGYAAAFLAADLGLSVTLIDEAPNPGGVCLYRGCIPSKALLHVAKVIGDARDAEEWGVRFTKPRIDLDKVRGWKESVVGRMTGGLGSLARQRKVTLLQGRGRFTGSQEIAVAADAGEQRVGFDHAIISTGSRPAVVPALALDSDRVLDSTSALELPDVPKRLLVVGGGYIGLELGSAYAALGSAVTVVEMTDGLLPGVDRDLVGILERRLRGSLAAIHTGTRVDAVEETERGLAVTLSGSAERHQERFDRMLVSVGRVPNTGDLGLENTGRRGRCRRVHRARRPATHRRPGDLRRRRRGRTADAGAQGVARRARRRRGGGRQAGRVRAAGHSRRGVHRSRDRLVRADRDGGQGARPRRADRTLPVGRPPDARPPWAVRKDSPSCWSTPATSGCSAAASPAPAPAS